MPERWLGPGEMATRLGVSGKALRVYEREREPERGEQSAIRVRSVRGGDLGIKHGFLLKAVAAGSPLSGGGCERTRQPG